MLIPWSNVSGHRILEGYREQPGQFGEELKRLLVTFSNLVMDLKIHGIDRPEPGHLLDPRVVADARIMLRRELVKPLHAL
jgi:hypothetical protein